MQKILHAYFNNYLSIKPAVCGLLPFYDIIIRFCMQSKYLDSGSFALNCRGDKIWLLLLRQKWRVHRM